MRRFLPLTLLLLILAPAAPSAAQGPGVHTDPDSPAGTEYEIPIDSARNQAADGDQSSSSPGSSDTGRTSGGGSDDGQAPLFGAGVRPRGSRSSSQRTSDRRPAKRHTSSSSSPTSRVEDVPAAIRRADERSVAGSGLTLGLLAPGLAALALGLLVGAVVRRRRAGGPAE